MLFTTHPFSDLSTFASTTMPSGRAPFISLIERSKCGGSATTSYAQLPFNETGDPTGDIDRLEHGVQENIDTPLLGVVGVCEPEEGKYN